MRRGLALPLKYIVQQLYNLYALRGHVRVGKAVHIGIGSVVWAPHDFKIGNDVFIGKYCTIECDGAIGNGVLIANHVGLVGRLDHDYRCIGRIMSQAPWIGDPEYTTARGMMPIIIEDDVWIGYGAVVLSGVRIGKGSIISANSLVVRNVSPYSIVGGNPARRLGARFSPEEIIEHESRLHGHRLKK